MATKRRNIVATEATPSVGDVLLRGVLASAEASTGFASTTTAGDAIVLDGDAPQLVGATAGDIADRWIFSGNRPLVRTVTVNGREVVADGRHRDREAIAARYATAMRGLLAG